MNIPRHINSVSFFQLLKFQSKNKKDTPTAQEEINSNAAQESEIVEENANVERQTTSSLFGGSDSAGLPSFPLDNTPVDSQQTLDNFSQLSQRFDSLEQELGRSLTSTTSSSQLYESQIQELSRKLAEERQSNQSLELRLREQYSNVDELTLKLQQSELGSVSKVQMELGPLKDQLDNQIRTVALLVGEKAALAANLAAAETIAKTSSLENEELHAKLNASRHQVQKFKEDLATLKKSQERYDSSQQNLCTEVETSRDELKALRRANDDLKEETLELRRKLELKEIDFNALETNHREKVREIDSLHLRLTQLVGADDDPLQRDRLVEANAQQKIALDAQIQELLQQVEKANTDRDTAATHYQNYVQQLNKERESWILKVQEATRERDELAKRDQQLVHHIGELEKQMQQQRSVQAKTNQPESSDETITANQRESEERILKQENDLEVLGVRQLRGSE